MTTRLTECCAEAAAALTDDVPADPDRLWAYRDSVDSGDGAESCNDEDGPIDTLASYQAFCDYWRERCGTLTLSSAQSDGGG